MPPNVERNLGGGWEHFCQWERWQSRSSIQVILERGPVIVYAGKKLKSQTNTHPWNLGRSICKHLQAFQSHDGYQFTLNLKTKELCLSVLRQNIQESNGMRISGIKDSRNQRSNVYSSNTKQANLWFTFSGDFLHNTQICRTSNKMQDCKSLFPRRWILCQLLPGYKLLILSLRNSLWKLGHILNSFVVCIIHGDSWGPQFLWLSW